MCVQVIMWTSTDAWALRSGVARSHGRSVFNLQETAKLFSKMVVPFYNLTNSVRVTFVLHHQHLVV